MAVFAEVAVAKLLGSGLLWSKLLAASYSKSGEFPKNVPDCGQTFLYVQQILLSMYSIAGTSLRIIP